MSQTFRITIVADSREQRPYAFEGYVCQVARAGLPSGDYSTPGHEDALAVERKELGDLVNCLSRERDRFERELARLSVMRCPRVIVEASVEDVRRHRYASRMLPHAVLQSVVALEQRYRVPFTWAGNRPGGEYLTYWSIQKFLREMQQATKVEVSPEALEEERP